MSSLRGKKRGGKSVGTKDAGPSSRTKKASDESSLRPLEGTVIYLDIMKKPPKLVDKLKADLKELGARVEPFLSKDITLLFTDRPDAADTSKSQAYPSGASPAVSTPSPFQQWKDSGATDSPANPSPSSCAAPMMTRGRAIANKADTSSKSRGSTDVLNNARNMGIPVKCLDKIMNYCEREIARLRKTSASTKGESSGQKSKKKERQLQRHFLKMEDLSRRFRPVSKEMDVWPRMVLDSGDNRSPFVGRVPPAQAQWDEAVPLTPTKAPQEAPESAQASRKSAQKSAKKSARKPKTPVAKKTKEAGYCECCRGRYSDLGDHVESSTHQYFVKNQSNYSSLDAMITEGPNMERFLRDCLQYQDSATSSSETSQAPSQADDDVVFISEIDPAGQPPNLGAAPASTRKSNVIHPSPPQIEQSKSPGKMPSQPKASTPPEKRKSSAGKKRKRSSTPQTGGDRVGSRLSPRLMERDIPPAVDGAEKRPIPSPQPLGTTEDAIMIVSSPPAPISDGKERIPGNTAGDTPMERRQVRDKGVAAENIPETLNDGSPARHSRVAAMTPLSPRSRLSLTRRRRRQMLDMSPASPPSKRKKQGPELGMIDCELPQEASTPRRRRSGGGDTDLVTAQRRKKEVSEETSSNQENLGSVKSVKKNQLEEQCNDCETNLQTESLSVRRPGNFDEPSPVVKPPGENRKFPQGTSNPSSPKPFLGHSHTDFGFNPTMSTQTRRLIPHQSEITGSEDERLRTIFRSDPMAVGENFEGFSNEEIHETELLHESFTKNSGGDIGGSNKETMRERLKSAALDVVYVPTSELGVPLPQEENGSESDSETSDGSVEVDIVFQKVENFPSDGSEWETQVQGFMTKLDEALEDREKEEKRVKEELRKKEAEMEQKKAELKRKEAESKRMKAEEGGTEQEEIPEAHSRGQGKENTWQSALEKAVLQVIASSSMRNRKPPRVEVLAESDGNVLGDSHMEDTLEEPEESKEQHQPLSATAARGRQLRSRKPVPAPLSSGSKENYGSCKYPASRTAVQDTASAVSPRTVIQGSPAKFSTPKSRRSSLEKSSLQPHVTFSPKVTVEEQEIIVNHFVHDGEEDEVSFPKLSSPAQEGWRSSPVRKLAQGVGEPKVSTPTRSHRVGRLRRRSLSTADSNRPLLFLRLSVSPSRNPSAPCPMSPPTSPFMKNAAAPPMSPFKKNANPPPPSPFKSPKTKKGAPQSKKSPPIFALLYDEGSRKRGLVPILVTNRRPNFSREILQPSLRLSLSKRRRRRASRTLAALNLSLPHIFDVFEFNDDGDDDQETNVTTAECGTQTPERKTRARAASFPQTGGATSRLRKTNPACRKLCIPTEGGGDAPPVDCVPQKSMTTNPDEESTKASSSSDLPGTSGQGLQGSLSTLNKAGDNEEGIQGTFEGSNLTRPFDLPLSFYM